MRERLIWRKDRALLDDLVFRLEYYKNDDWDMGSSCFAFYKTRELIDQYEEFWSSMEDFHPENILELGIWDGGSVAFWSERFRPRKHVAIDIAQRGDSEYFGRYIRSRGLEERIKTYWGTDQGDREGLLDIVRNEFCDPLDLVIDDASHWYEPTKASFETIFPLLRPGGLYVIEDWAWPHCDDQVPDEWSPEKEPTRLVTELVGATGTSPALIASLSILSGFVAIQRGKMGTEEFGEFKLENFIHRRR